MTLEVIGRRALDCKWWRWLPGMLSRRLSAPGVSICHRYSEADWPANPHGGEYPDLSDPATLGCVVALVREAWGAQIRMPEYWPADGDEPAYWAIELRGQDVCCPTEAEVLIEALESAPKE